VISNYSIKEKVNHSAHVVIIKHKPINT